MTKTSKKDNTPSADALKQFDSLPAAAGVRMPLACALLGCSPATIWRLCKVGKIRSLKISSRVTAFNVGSIRECLSVAGRADG